MVTVAAIEDADVIMVDMLQGMNTGSNNIPERR
jgi:hypothetical protein